MTSHPIVDGDVWAGCEAAFPWPRLAAGRGGIG